MITPIASHQGWRRATQAATLALLALVPALGAFRIDLAAGSLMLMGHAVALRDFPVVAGFALVLATAPLVMVTSLGTFWCGWACPQNTLSEWANRRTRHWLGSRADVSVEGAGLRVAPSKNRANRWLALLGEFALASLVLGAVPLFFFVPPAVMWSIATRTETAQLSGFLGRLYGVFVAAAFVDIALVRYFLCNYACLYRFGHLLFRNRNQLQVAYDAGRAGECARCKLCRVVCVTGVDPTHLQPFDRCVQCAECIDACEWLHRKDGGGAEGGLLRFARPGGIGHLRRAAAMLGWPGLACLAGVLLMAYGWLQA